MKDAGKQRPPGGRGAAGRSLVVVGPFFERLILPGRNRIGTTFSRRLNPSRKAAGARMKPAPRLLSSVSENLRRLCHVLSHRHPEGTSLFARAASHAFARMMAERPVVLPNSFRRLTLRAHQVEKLGHLRHGNAAGAWRTMTAVHSEIARADLGQSGQRRRIILLPGEAVS